MLWLKRTVALGVTLSCLLWYTPDGTAGYQEAPSPLGGWSRGTPYADDTWDRHGVLLSGEPIARSSPLIADVDGDPSDGLEVVIGGDDGMLYVFGSGGTVRWSVDLTPSACSASRVSSRPTVGDLYGNGVPYLAVTFDAMDCDGGLRVYDGRTGDMEWSFSTREWEAIEGYPAESLVGVYSTPAMADTEGDGRLEIAFGALDRNLYLLESDGTVRWYYHAADTIFSSPAFMDIDGDGPLELIVGTDISANPDINPPMTDGGFVYAFDTQVRSTKRIDFSTGYVWRTPNLGQVIFSSPAIGDVLDTNPGPEIVIGNGCFFPSGFADKKGKWVKILRPADGAVLQTLTVPAGGSCVQSSAALGDIDDDGRLEIVFTMGSGLDTGGDGLGRIVAWDPETPTPKWSMVPYSPHRAPGDSEGNDAYGGDLQSPVIADLDGNGSLEVLVANFWSVHVLSGVTGAPLTCMDNTCGSRISLFAWGTLKSTPAIGDIDGDGDLDVVIGGTNIYAPANRGMLYAWTDFAGVLGSTSGAQTAYSAPWPMFQSNESVVGSPGPAAPDPEPGPGAGADPCSEFQAASQDGIQCEIDQLLLEPPCTLTASIEHKLNKASQSLAATTTASDKKARRLRKRTRKALAAVRRKTRSRRMPAECRSTLRGQVEELIGRVKSI